MTTPEDPIEFVEESKQTLYFEGHIAPGMNPRETRMLEENVASTLIVSDCTFNFGENIMMDANGVDVFLCLLHLNENVDFIDDLRIVEYTGTGPEKYNRFCMTKGWKIKVHLYVLYDHKEILDSEESDKADLTYLPNARFDRQWERLTYEDDWKSIMMNMAKNMVLPGTHETRDRCPLILLHGPAGTGKTTLAQSLAQKLSIRLAHKFLITKLFEIRNAMLFSKKFGESARFVDEVFVKVRKASEEDDQALIIVLIDEVESIASSRRIGMMQEEAQDAYKATNALLTHLDKLKQCKNVILICTTNHLTYLDPALLDRCVCRKEIKLPQRKAQYKILRDKVQELIHTGDINSDVNLPELIEAKRVYRAREWGNPACKLYSLLETFRAVNLQSHPPTGLSGRYLASLPNNALDMFKQEKIPELDVAFEYFAQYAKLDCTTSNEKDEDSDSVEEDQNGERSDDDDVDMQISPEVNSYRGPESGGSKRIRCLLVVEGSPGDIEDSVKVLKQRGVDVFMRINNMD